MSLAACEKNEPAETTAKENKPAAEILLCFDVKDEEGLLGADYEIPDAAFGE